MSSVHLLNNPVKTCHNIWTQTRSRYTQPWSSLTLHDPEVNWVNIIVEGQWNIFPIPKISFKEMLFKLSFVSNSHSFPASMLHRGRDKTFWRLQFPIHFRQWKLLLSGVPDFFDRNKILSGYDLSHYQVPHCIRVFFLILFDLCLFITIFNFILNYVPIVTFWILTYHKFEFC